MLPFNTHIFHEHCGLIVIIAISEVTATIYGTSLRLQSFENIIITVMIGFLYKFLYVDVMDGTVGTVGTVDRVKVPMLNQSAYWAMLYIN